MNMHVTAPHLHDRWEMALTENWADPGSKEVPRYRHERYAMRRKFLWGRVWPYAEAHQDNPKWRRIVYAIAYGMTYAELARMLGGAPRQTRTGTPLGN